MSASEIDKQIGARIRDRREALGMTQKVFAQHLGVTFQQVQKYEKGENRVAAPTLILAARALRCPAGDLLGEGLPEDGEEGGLAELRRAWIRMTSEQQEALLQLMRAMA